MNENTYFTSQNITTPMMLSNNVPDLFSQNLHKMEGAH